MMSVPFGITSRFAKPAIRGILATVIVAGLLGATVTPAMAQPITDLNAVPTPGPDPANLSLYVKGVASHPVPNVTPQRLTVYPDKLIALGKAFFWDMQVGSDGATACATCHFKAGADDREKNTMVPGPDGLFQPGVGRNGQVGQASFPFHKMVNAMSRGTGGIDPNDPAVVHDFDDTVGSQGVVQGNFAGLIPGSPEDPGQFTRGGAQLVNGRLIRQITGRNTPPAINAVFNQTNFWDGRAHNVFNGVDPFGPLSPDARIHEWNGASIAQLNMMTPATVLINSSTASQAVGPPLSDVEMSWKGRTFPELGTKMLFLRPLAGQRVHPDDSVFGFLGLVDPSGMGLNTTYTDLIREVFQDRFWNAPEGTFVTLDGKAFTLMEANFSLFWGIAVQAYESILVADDTPVDRFERGDAAALANFSAQLQAATGLVNLDAQRGMSRFESGALACANCHGSAETTLASVSALALPGEGLVELMPSHGTVIDGILRFYDVGFYNIGVHPVGDDRGRGGFGPNNIPLAISRHRDLTRPGIPANFDPTIGGLVNVSPICDPVEAAAVGLTCPPDAVAVAIDEGTAHDTGEPFGADGNLAINGSYKTPHLRNVELTGPYFHTGGAATLMQVVEFYSRGGDFLERNAAFIPIDFKDNVGPLNDGGDGTNLLERQNVVAFLLALTDERVRQESAPFDHPQLFYAEGHAAAIEGNPKVNRRLKDIMVEVKATGRLGRSADGIDPLIPSFSTPGDAMFHFRPTP